MLNPYVHNNCITPMTFEVIGQNFIISVGITKDVCVSYNNMKSALTNAVNYMANCNHRCLAYYLSTNGQSIEVQIVYFPPN